MKTTTVEVLPANIYKTVGGYEGKVKVGTGASALRASKYWTVRDDAAMIRWVTTTRAALQKEAAQLPPRAEHGTLAGAVRRYFETATLSSTNRQRLTQQLGFWCAQPAALGAPVLTPDAFHADREANRGRTLGEAALVRMKFGNAFALSLPPAVLDRIRKVLREAFAPTDPDNNPTEFANTANHYRGALLSLFAVLNENVAGAPNPITLIKTRSRDEAALSGQDMRIVREILAQLPTKFGRPSDLGERRLAVLAWVHLTPKQLSQLSPADFHDVDDATRDDLIAGVVTLTKPPRHKGRSSVVPRPETIPLTPYGVEAMRAFVAAPGAFGKFSTASLNKQFKRAAAKAQAALAAKGVAVDLSGMTMYHLKHSLASALSVATAGTFDRAGKLQQSPAVVRSLDHRRGRTSAIYTASSVAPILLQANLAMTEYLDRLLATPLTPAASLKIVSRT